MNVCIKHDITKENFQQEIQQHRKPCILQGLDIGNCVSKWNKDYLSTHAGEKLATVHVCETAQMNFVTRNYVYREDVRREPSDISKQWPEIYKDIKLPYFFPEEKLFSSVFRIASAGMQLWTHYDVMDNLLIQVSGRKKVVLFPPCDASNLYLEGDKSVVVDVDNPDLEKYPNFFKAQKYECFLNAGDVLFIPALWFHNVVALDFGIAVNVFWKNLDIKLYDMKDPYGNKDLIPAARSMDILSRALKVLNEMPEEYKDFYARKMISKIEKSSLLEINHS